MANNLPQFSYGSGPTVFALSYPPEGDPFNEVLEYHNEQKESETGIRQTKHNFKEKVYEISFVFVSEAQMASIRTFLDTHAGLGNSFSYSPHSDVPVYTTVELDSFKVPIRIIMGDGAGGSIYEVKMKFRVVY